MHNPQPPYNQQFGADPISGLRTDTEPPSHDEEQLVNTLFKQHRGTISTLFEEAKDSLIGMVLFILFSLEPVTALFHRFIPSTSTSPYILIGIKGLTFAVVFWIIRHFYLARSAPE